MQSSGVAVALWSFCILGLLRTAATHRMCNTCIPLEDLLSEAYGITISSNKLFSAVAFHNGSMAPLGSVDASPEFTSLIQPLLSNMSDGETRTATTRCPAPRAQMPPETGVLALVKARLQWILELVGLSAEKNQQQAPMHPTAELIQRQLLELPPFASMSPEARSRAPVAVSVPSWLTGSEEVCHLRQAAERTFRLVRLENTPSAAYTAAGYELCRISYDAFECTGPGRLMTLELEEGLAVVSLVRTSLDSVFEHPVTFAARKVARTQGIAQWLGFASSEPNYPRVVEWLEDFVDAQKPDKFMLAGPEAENSRFKKALEKSNVVHMLEMHMQHLLAGDVVTLGTAQAAKDAIETQVDDCGEWPECEEIRREADRISGRYVPSATPSLWAHRSYRHSEL